MDKGVMVVRKAWKRYTAPETTGIEEVDVHTVRKFTPVSSLAMK